FEDDEWYETPIVAGDAGEHHEVLLGIPAETSVDFKIAPDGSESKLYSAKTGSLPLDLPVVDIVAWDEIAASPDRWMLGSVDDLPYAYDGTMWSCLRARKGRDDIPPRPDRWMLRSVDDLPYAYDGTMWSFLLDRKGRYVWYHETPDNK